MNILYGWLVRILVPHDCQDVCNRRWLESANTDTHDGSKFECRLCKRRWVYVSEYPRMSPDDYCF